MQYRHKVFKKCTAIFLILCVSLFQAMPHATALSVGEATQSNQKIDPAMSITTAVMSPETSTEPDPEAFYGEEFGSLNAESVGLKDPDNVLNEVDDSLLRESEIETALSQIQALDTAVTQGTSVLSMQTSESVSASTTTQTSVVASSPLVPPLNQAQGGVDANILDWEPSADPLVTGYNIYRRVFGAEEWVLTGTVSGNMSFRYIDSTIDSQEVYQYRVFTNSATGELGPVSLSDINYSANYQSAYPEGLQPENVLILINENDMGYVDLGRSSSGEGEQSGLPNISEVQLLEYLHQASGDWQDADHDGVYYLYDGEGHVYARKDTRVEGAPILEVPLGVYYALRRQIPLTHLIFLSGIATGERARLGATNEEDALVFERMIQTIHDAMVARGIAGDIASVVSAYHFPLVRGGQSWVGNPRPGIDMSWEEALNGALWASFGGGELDIQNRHRSGRSFSRSLGDVGFLSTRIDAADVVTAQRMIDDAVWAEENYRFGEEDWSNSDLNAYVDWSGAYGSYTFREASGLIGQSGFFGSQGDHWDEAADINDQWIRDHPQYDLDQDGRLDNTFLFTGWYNPDNYQDDFNWAQGAIGWSLDSYSGKSFRNAYVDYTASDLSNRSWGANIISHGAAATLGAVHEPGLAGHTEPSRFVRFLLAGYSFAEAGYFGTAPFGMGVLPKNMAFNGDPLYAPFRSSRSPIGARFETLAHNDTDGESVARWNYAIGESILDPYKINHSAYRDFDSHGRLTYEQLENGTKIQYFPDGNVGVIFEGVPQYNYIYSGQSSAQKAVLYDQTGQPLVEGRLPWGDGDVLADVIVPLESGGFEIHRSYRSNTTTDVFDSHGNLKRLNSSTPFSWTLFNMVVGENEEVDSIPYKYGDLNFRVDREDGNYLLAEINPSQLSVVQRMRYFNAQGELLVEIDLNQIEGGSISAPYSVLFNDGFRLNEVGLMSNEPRLTALNAVDLIETLLPLLQQNNTGDGSLHFPNGALLVRSESSGKFNPAYGQYEIIYGVQGIVNYSANVDHSYPTSIDLLTGERFVMQRNDDGVIQRTDYFDNQGRVQASIVRNANGEGYHSENLASGFVFESIDAESPQEFLTVSKELVRYNSTVVRHREILVEYLAFQGVRREDAMNQIDWKCSPRVSDDSKWYGLSSLNRTHNGESRAYDFYDDGSFYYMSDGNKEVVFDENNKLAQIYDSHSSLVQNYRYFEGCACSRIIQEGPVEDIERDPKTFFYYTAEGAPTYRVASDAQGIKTYHLKNQSIVAARVLEHESEASVSYLQTEDSSFGYQLNRETGDVKLVSETVDDRVVIYVGYEDKGFSTQDEAEAYRELIQEPTAIIRRVPVLPSLQLVGTIPDFTNNPILTVHFTVDGVAQEQVFQLVDGDNSGLVIMVRDQQGSLISSLPLSTVVLDREDPVIAIVGEIPESVNFPFLSVTYTVDGGEEQSIVLPLEEGDNENLRVTGMDRAGNLGVLNLPVVRYIAPNLSQGLSIPSVLGDGAAAVPDANRSAREAQVVPTMITASEFMQYISGLGMSYAQLMSAYDFSSHMPSGASVYRYDGPTQTYFTWTSSQGQSHIFSFENATLLFGEILKPILSSSWY